MLSIIRMPLFFLQPFYFYTISHKIFLHIGYWVHKNMWQVMSHAKWSWDLSVH